MELSIPTIDKVNPSLWGKNAWEFLDVLILTYPVENPQTEKRDSLQNLFESLGDLLPCPDCRNHFKNFLKKNSLLNALGSRNNLLDFYYRLRYDIAQKTNKRLPFRNKDELWVQILMKYKIYIPPKQQLKPFLNNRITPIRPSNTELLKRVRTLHNSSLSCNCGL